MNDIFDFSRFGKLLKSDLFLKKSSIIIIAITIIGVLLFFNLIIPNNIITVDYHPTGFLLLLFIGGIWISSRSFRHLHDKSSSYFYLTLSCSNFEKFLAKLVLSSIIYAVSVLAIYVFFYWLLALVSWVFFHQGYFIVTPFLATTWKMIWLYMIIQSMFLLGSIYFKRLPLVKTILAIACIGIVVFLLITIFAEIFLSGVSVNVLFWVPHIVNAHHVALRIFHFVFWVLFAPFCWMVTYFRLKEIEV